MANRVSLSIQHAFQSSGRMFHVACEVDWSIGNGEEPDWRVLTRHIEAPDAVTAALLIGWLVGGVPRPIRNVHAFACDCVA